MGICISIPEVASLNDEIKEASHGDTANKERPFTAPMKKLPDFNWHT